MKHALVYGGAGALGQALVATFRQRSFTVMSIDVRANPNATHNILLDANSSSWEEQHQLVVKEVEQLLQGEPLHAILCVAGMPSSVIYDLWYVDEIGGWAGGNAKDKDLITTCELMWKQSVQSSVIAARLAALYLAEYLLDYRAGQVPVVPRLHDPELLVQQYAFYVIPGLHHNHHLLLGMIGYGMAKAAVHQLAKSLASEGSGLPKGARVLAILPVTLDTPGNRAAMPKADTSAWTPLQEVADKLVAYEEGTLPMKESGQLMEILTKHGKTEWNIVP